MEGIMKKILAATFALMIFAGMTVANAVSLDGVERNTDRYLLLSKTAESAVYLDKKSVELEMVEAPNYEIEANRVVVDYKKGEIIVLEEKFFYNVENKESINYVIDERNFYDLKGRKIHEEDVYDGLKKAKKGEDEFKYGDIAFALLYGNHFSR